MDYEIKEYFTKNNYNITAVVKLDSCQQKVIKVHYVDISPDKFLPLLVNSSLVAKKYSKYYSWWNLHDTRLPMREYTALTLFKQPSQVLVPKVHKLYDNIIIMEYLRGYTLDKCLKTVWNKEDIIKQVAINLYNIYNTTRNNIKDIMESEIFIKVDYNSILDQDRRWLEKLWNSDHDVDNVGELEKEWRVLSKKSINIDTWPLSLIHGDYHPGNIIVNKFYLQKGLGMRKKFQERIVGIVDWEESVVGDIRLDIAWMWQCLDELKEYGSFSRLFLDYCNYLWGTPIDVDYWIRLFKLNRTLSELVGN